jgi:replication factor A2
MLVLNQVSFVARVMNMSRGTTHYSFDMHDGTGSIDVRLWMDSADDDSGHAQGVEYV